MTAAGKILRVLALAAACLLTACIDGHEEIWIHRDGSGRADIRYSLPAAAATFHGGEAGMRKMLGDFLAANPALVSPQLDVTTEEKRLHVRVRAEFESALDLKQLSTPDSMSRLPASASGIAGRVAMEITPLAVNFTRTINAGASLPGSAFMPASQFKDRTLSYTIHLPESATGSNATRIENAGRTLVWEIPLADAVRQPFATHFTAPVPWPGWLVPAACAGFAAVVLLAWSLWRIRRRKAPAV